MFPDVVLTGQSPVSQSRTYSRVAIFVPRDVVLGDDGIGCLAVELFRSKYEFEVKIVGLRMPGKASATRGNFERILLSTAD